MKFQIPFYRDFKYFDKNKTQIFIKYKPDIKKLDNFIKEYSEYRIVIAFEEKDSQGVSFLASVDKKTAFLNDCKIIQTLLKINANLNVDITVRIPIYHEIIEEILNEYNIPHYYQYICCDWEDLLGFCSLNITDIRIGGNLAFMMEFVKNFTKERGIRIRCFCNYCEKKWDTINIIKNFFIRPEDILLYAKYVDTFEFKDINNNEAYNTLYEIYAIEHKWNGKLNEIIFNYDGEEDNRTIIPNFGKYRLRCQRKCFMVPNFCRVCDRVKEASDFLKGRNLVIDV